MSFLISAYSYVLNSIYSPFVPAGSTSLVTSNGSVFNVAN
jgi:hypothetical protein